MHILIGGGSGFIGRHLVKKLTQKGHQVTIVSRSATKSGTTQSVKRVTWDDLAKFGANDDVDALVNLAGEPILSIKARLQPDAFQKAVRDSRLETAKICARLCNEGNIGTYIQGTAVGYYHLEPSAASWDEDSKGGTQGAMAKLVADWEAASKLEEDSKTRQVLLRTGVVLGNDGGIIQNTMPSFKLGLGGPISFRGEQILNWIHIDDEVGIIEYALENDQISGVINAVAPEIQTNGQWAKSFAKELGRPCMMFVPSCVMDLAYGADIAKIVNEGTVVESSRLDGYSFKFPTMQSAMQDIVLKSPGLVNEVKALFG